MYEVIMNLLGIDVSKNKLDSALILVNKPTKFLDKKTPNHAKGFDTLLQWCCKKASCSPQELHIILEATGPYHEKVALWMYKAGCKVSVLNPARIKNFAQSQGFRSKNDQLDAKIIARFGQKMEPKLWEPTVEKYQELHNILNRIQTVSKEIQSEKNRLEKQVATASPSKSVIQSISRTIVFLEEEKKQLKCLVKEHIDQDPELKMDQTFLESIPGVGPELGQWMNNLLKHGTSFQNAKQVVAYLGLNPTEHTSGISVSKRPRISKAGPAVYRAKLFMPAIVAFRYNPDVKALYERLLAKGKSKMAAVVAAMRKLVHICFGVIKHQTKYQSQIT